MFLTKILHHQSSALLPTMNDVIFVQAMTWIERQTELNWRFRHIYSLVPWSKKPITHWFGIAETCSAEVGQNENRTNKIESGAICFLGVFVAASIASVAGYFLLTTLILQMGSHWPGQWARFQGDDSHEVDVEVKITGCDVTTVDRISSRRVCDATLSGPKKNPFQFVFFLEALVNHPRDVIPPFTHAMMKKAWVRRCLKRSMGYAFGPRLRNEWRQLWLKWKMQRMPSLSWRCLRIRENHVHWYKQIPVAAWTFGILRIQAKAAEAPNQEEMEREMKEAAAFDCGWTLLAVDGISYGVLPSWHRYSWHWSSCSTASSDSVVSFRQRHAKRRRRKLTSKRWRISRPLVNSPVIQHV